MHAKATPAADGIDIRAVPPTVHAGDVLRMPAVVQRTGLGRSTIYRLMAARQFPRPVRLTRRAVGWRRADLDRWSASLPMVDG